MHEHSLEADGDWHLAMMSGTGISRCGVLPENPTKFLPELYRRGVLPRSLSRGFPAGFSRQPSRSCGLEGAEQLRNTYSLAVTSLREKAESNHRIHTSLEDSLCSYREPG